MQSYQIEKGLLLIRVGVGRGERSIGQEVPIKGQAS